MNSYGQVYRTMCDDFYSGSEEFPYGMGFRGILMDDTHKEVWIGKVVGTPDAAFIDMQKHAPRHLITDLRPWSGLLPERMI